MSFFLLIIVLGGSITLFMKKIEPMISHIMGYTILVLCPTPLVLFLFYLRVMINGTKNFFKEMQK